MKRQILFVIVMLSFCAVVSGCAKKPEAPAAKIVAKINGYELTAEDFNDELRLTAANKNLSVDPMTAKEEMLDGIIAKKILLQEAQAQNFDKDRSFMKEIERYWEQALIKLMVRKKKAELSRSVTIGENEVRDEYERLFKESGGKIGPFEAMASTIKDYLYGEKMQRLFDEWLEKLRSGADIKIYKENL